jgi:Protein of unknown function (DUF3667)
MTSVPPDAPAPRPAAPDPATRCTNCGAAISGKYCSACGQRVEYHVDSLRDLLSEAAEVLTHADSRLWRSLGLLMFRPGALTQQYLAGRRASYLPPFRLYIVFSVLFFLIVTVTREPAAQATRAATDAAAVSHPRGDGTTDGSQPEHARPAPAAAKTPEEICERSVGHSLIPGADRLRAPFVAACLKTRADDSRELGEKFIHNLGRAMFLLLPLFAGFMRLLYWRPPRTYVTHLLLLVHNHAFMFLLMSVVLLALYWVRSGALITATGFVVAGYVAWYLYQSMRRVYAQAWWLTLLKFTTLSLAYIFCAACTVLVAGLYSAETI